MKIKNETGKKFHMSDYVAPRENNGTFIFTSSHSVVRSRLPFPPPLSTMGILSGDEKNLHTPKWTA